MNKTQGLNWTYGYKSRAFIHVIPSFCYFLNLMFFVFLKKKKKVCLLGSTALYYYIAISYTLMSPMIPSLLYFQIKSTIRNKQILKINTEGQILNYKNCLILMNYILSCYQLNFSLLEHIVDLYFLFIHSST